MTDKNIFFEKRDRSPVSQTAITLKFKMRRFQNEAHWWAEQLQTEIKYTVSYAWWGQKLWWLFSFGFKKMMTLREDNLSQSEGPLLINCLSTWRPYCNPLLTNHDANYNLRRTLLMLSGQFANTWRLQTCFFCMWNHCSPTDSTSIGFTEYGDRSWITVTNRRHHWLIEPFPYIDLLSV